MKNYLFHTGFEPVTSKISIDQTDNEFVQGVQTLSAKSNFDLMVQKVVQISKLRVFS